MAATVIDTLFGDLPVWAWPPDDAGDFPWSAFVQARREPEERAIELWLEIAHADVGPRHVLQAWHFLRAHGVRPPAEEARRVLGLVVETRSKKGVDVLAVYADRSVRYYTEAGGGIVLEPAPPERHELIDALLDESAVVVASTGPWSGPRATVLAAKETRLTFLTPGGPHVGRGPTKQLAQDALGGLVLKGATLLLSEIAARS
jgi:hypothetical protein